MMEEEEKKKFFDGGGEGIDSRLCGLLISRPV